ncbi:sulfate/molybdate ABC transporter ATP-binding protein [Nocardioides alcanivorans]|uniref:sulfate/molybdate ABC transporter ATP-binding protein n=1 Tax=Nocardioides alcanivorans TaxID=2897352 RepID=UPI001F1D6B34|nr:ATP-binding cassette domain-containing protein [Nocardioides alcanivorans]
MNDQPRTDGVASTALSLNATHQERRVDVQLEVAAGETVALLGPNGAGKSTVIGLLAGLLRPDSGRAQLGSRTLFDTGRWLPPHARGIALMAQDPLLFPHLSVLENVAFGPRSTGVPRREARARALRWLEAVDASEFAGRKQAQLSGGQAQRISIARALAAEPDLLLLDEPMAALDVTMMPAMRQLLRRVLVDRTAIIVTHDVLDALMLADRVVIMEGGLVVEVGATADVLTRPRSTFGARLADLNLCPGVATAGGVRLADGFEMQGIAHEGTRVGEHAVAAFSPKSVALHLDPPGGSPRNALPLTVRELEPRGPTVRVHGTAPSGVHLAAEVTAAVIAELDLVPGQQVHAVVKALEVSIYPN